MKDGGLRFIFRDKFRTYQWISVETAGTASGVPDNEFCTPDGVQGWLELKQTHQYNVRIRPLQIAWLMRRCRYGGNAWIAVRRIPHAAIHEGADELWLMRGDQAQALFEGGLLNIHGWKWSGGPGNWNYAEIDSVFRSLHPK